MLLLYYYYQQIAIRQSIPRLQKSNLAWKDLISVSEMVTNRTGVYIFCLFGSCVIIKTSSFLGSVAIGSSMLINEILRTKTVLRKYIVHAALGRNRIVRDTGSPNQDYTVRCVSVEEREGPDS